MILIMITIIFINNDTLQIMAKSKQQSHNFKMPVESYKNFYGQNR